MIVRRERLLSTFLGPEHAHFAPASLRRGASRRRYLRDGSVHSKCTEEGEAGSNLDNQSGNGEL